MEKIALVMGTRPEVIKCAPLVVALQEAREFEPVVIASGQHGTMAEQAFAAFGVSPSIDLRLMQPEQTPNAFLSRLLASLEGPLRKLNPAAVIVQGDTTTALGAAICAFHQRLPLGHLEAGLRTHRMDSPFPEEMNRSVISKIATMHFCPTQRARDNLRDEGIQQNVAIVGNTVVDAALLMNKRLEQGLQQADPEVQQLFTPGTRVLLVTGHRRENFSKPLENLCSVLLRIRDAVPDIQIVYPVHLNPNVAETVYGRLANQQRIQLIEPVNYPTLLYLIKHSTLIISDSGGIQEEAPTFHRRVLVTRNTTERPEAIESGFAVLTPLERPEALEAQVLKELRGEGDPIPTAANPFGDGNAAQKVVAMLQRLLPR